LNGEAILFAGLWSNSDRDLNGVDDSCKGACVKDTPKIPFLGDDLRGELCPGVKFGCDKGIISSRRPKPPCLGVPKWAFFGDALSGEFCVGVKLGWAIDFSLPLKDKRARLGVSLTV
jgi:hypothetical protein